jgi:Zn-dependent M28 family amino/carboxypeptidase
MIEFLKVAGVYAAVIATPFVLLLVVLAIEERLLRRSSAYARRKPKMIDLVGWRRSH